MVFAVPLHCQSCVKDISKALSAVPSIGRFDVDLASQLVYIQGSAPPSLVIKSIQATGRDAILRGSGAPNSSAVCILESHAIAPGAEEESPVKGLARMVEVSPTSTLIDLTIRGLPAGTYDATIRETGDISRGPASTGKVWPGKGVLGQILVDATGEGQAFLERPLRVWELVGRAMVVGKQGAEERDGVVGVIARSAGAWENSKTVCSCSGKTVWEERQDARRQGIL